MALPDSVAVVEPDTNTWTDAETEALCTMLRVDNNRTDTPTRIIFTGRESTLELYRASHSFRWYLNDLESRLGRLQPFVGGDAMATTVAEAHLASIDWNNSPWGLRLGLMSMAFPQSPVPSHGSRIQLGVGSSSPSAPVVVAYHVNYSLLFESIRLTEGSGRLRVMVDADGAVSEMTYFSRLPSNQPLQLVDAEVVSRTLRTLQRHLDSHPGVFDGVTMKDLRYFTVSPHRRQELLFPVFEVRGVRPVSNTPFIRYYKAFQPSQDASPLLKDLNAYLSDF